MPDIESKVDKAEDQAKQLKTGADKLGTLVDKHLKEFETINSALHEGRAVMKDLKGELAKLTDPDKIIKKGEEIKDAAETFKKMVDKLKTVLPKVSDAATSANNLQRTIDGFADTVADLAKEQTRTASDDPRALADRIKKLQEAAKKLAERVGEMVDNCKIPKPVLEM